MRLPEVPPTCRCEPARCTVGFLASSAGEREYRAWNARTYCAPAGRRRDTRLGRRYRPGSPGPLIDGSEAHLPQLDAGHPARLRAARRSAQVHWLEPVPRGADLAGDAAGEHRGREVGDLERPDP